MIATLPDKVAKGREVVRPRALRFPYPVNLIAFKVKVRHWWSRAGSNRRAHRYQAGRPLEQTPIDRLAERIGIEPEPAHLLQFGFHAVDLGVDHAVFFADGIGVADVQYVIVRSPVNVAADGRSSRDHAPDWRQQHKTGGLNMIIHTAIITHKHGNDVFVARTQAGLMHALAAYALESWGEADLPETDDGKPQTADMTDEQIVAAYFDVMNERESEWYETSTAELGD